jgi:hypothetical protein
VEVFLRSPKLSNVVLCTYISISGYFNEEEGYVRFEVLTAVRMKMFFWVLTPCGLVSEKHTVSIFPAWRLRIGSYHFPSFLDSDWPIPP